MPNIHQIIDEITTISTKPQNLWVRYRLVSEFAGFPADIAGVIVDYLQIFKLRDWIDTDEVRNFIGGADEVCNFIGFAKNEIPRPLYPF